MRFVQSFKLAIKSIMASKVRSLLTMLGIIIGVAAVIGIVGLGNGMETYMKDSFASMGTNILTVNVMGRGSSRSIDVDDLYAFVEENKEYFEAVSPTVNVNGSVKIGNETLKYTTIMGTGEDYISMKQYSLDSGRYIEYIDILRRNKVCVVGNYIDDTYFLGDSLGKSLKINGNTYTIIGVMSEDAESEEGSTDDFVYIPYSNASKISYIGNISSYNFSVVSEDNISVSKKLLENKLYDVFGSDNAYSVISMAEILDTMSSMIKVMVTILASIAAISLVVGGIGIMNIMLVSVSERTREIGIRKALGAKQKHIMRQFVIEAATTSALGGFVGILLGYMLSYIATSIVVVALDTDLKVIPSTFAVFGAFTISVAIGILFGYLPAKKAAKLNPIDALHRE
ncbi:MAG TPA: ABC transporter permease [Clostridiales bacterium]|nr:ABC transporter permease [Clostridiales bacterium]